MRVVERTRHIDLTLSGTGIPFIRDAILKAYPDTKIIDDDSGDEYVDWEETDIAKEIRAERTPGLVLQAYRERAGLTLVELAEKIGTKYTAISAMENNRRTIGLRMAKKLGEALSVDYMKFLV